MTHDERRGTASTLFVVMAFHIYTTHKNREADHEQLAIVCIADEYVFVTIHGQSMFCRNKDKVQPKSERCEFADQ